jgi:hypothetical protein
MKNTLLTITRVTADNKVTVRTQESRVFTVPSTWCFMSSYRGIDSYTDSAGATIEVAHPESPLWTPARK